jgi:hypothetical protein
MFVLAGMALLLAVLAILAAEDLRLFRHGARTSRGTVSGHRRGVDEGQPTFAPVIAFEDGEGQLRTITDSLWRAAPVPPVGTAVTVLHGPGGSPVRVHRPLARLAGYGALLAGLVLLASRLGSG